MQQQSSVEQKNPQVSRLAGPIGQQRATLGTLKLPRAFKRARGGKNRLALVKTVQICGWLRRLCHKP